MQKGEGSLEKLRRGIRRQLPKKQREHQQQTAEERGTSTKETLTMTEILCLLWLTRVTRETEGESMRRKGAKVKKIPSAMRMKTCSSVS